MGISILFKRLLPPACLCSIGMLSVFQAAWFSGFKKLQIGLVDPRLINYILEHTYLWTKQQYPHKSFWDAPILFPAANVGGYTDTMLGVAPLYWIWRVLGFDANLAFQIWMMACFFLNFFSAWLFLRRCLGTSPWASATGAFIFGFGINRVASLGSPQLLPLFWGMFAIYSLYRILEDTNEEALERRKSVWVFAFGVFLVLQVWSCFYPSFFLILILLISFLVSLFNADNRSRFLKLLFQYPLPLIAVGIIGLIAISPMVLAHLSVVEELGWRTYRIKSLPVWASWFFPGTHSLFYGGLSDFSFFNMHFGNQHQNGVGFLTATLSLYGFILNRNRPLVRSVFLTTLAVILVSTNLFGGFSFWRFIYDWIPGAGAIRYPSRIGMYLTIPCAIGLALFLDSFRRSKKVWVLIVLIAFCIGEQLQFRPFRENVDYQRSIDYLTTKIAKEIQKAPVTPSAFVLVATDNKIKKIKALRRCERALQVASMWASIELKLPTVNGHYGQDPINWRLQRLITSTNEDLFRVKLALEKWLKFNDLPEFSVVLVEVPTERLPCI